MLLEPDRFDDPQMNGLLPAQAPNRRGFIAAGASVGFALAAGPLNAQSAIHTPADGLDVADLMIPVADGKTMPGYRAAPARAGRHPVVIVVPEVFGMHEYQKDICRRLARLGYFGITQDPFFRIGDLARMSDIGAVVKAANSLPDPQMLSDLDSLVAFVDGQPRADARRIGITGMCRGGRTVWMYTAHSPRIKAGVAWYGGLNAVPPAMPRTPHDIAGQLHAPVLGLYGGADPSIPVAEVARLQEELKAGNRNSQASRFILFPGVGHAFHADYRASYNREAAEAGWTAMLDWFKSHGVA